MTRFHGVVGYGESVDKGTGVWEDVITEVSYFGDVVRNTRQSREGEYLNNTLSVNNDISIVADAYANEHFYAIKYVVWSGAYWTVTEVKEERPRLILSLGGVYNGPKGESANTP